MPTHEATPTVPRLVKGERLTGHHRQQIAHDLLARYRDGESLRTLAVSIGRSYTSVRQMLHEAGVTFRPRGGPRRTRNRFTGQFAADTT